MLAIRLRPGEDLKNRIDELVRDEGIAAGIILCGVGSLESPTLRFAGHNEGTIIPGPVEIVSLAGTLGEGGSHIHLGLADEHGQGFGGHLLAGCRVRTTCELVIGELSGASFVRECDAATGFPELAIRPILLPPEATDRLARQPPKKS